MYLTGVSIQCWKCYVHQLEAELSLIVVVFPTGKRNIVEI